jgi:hypothetical protein
MDLIARVTAKRQSFTYDALAFALDGIRDVRGKRRKKAAQSFLFGLG